MNKLALFISFVVIVSTTAFSQNTPQLSIIKGTVIEDANGKSLPGATVLIIGTKMATQSDAEGNFIFRNVPVGRYNLQFSAFTFSTKIISEVETTKDETTNLTVSLLEENNTLKEVVITTTKMKAESLKSLLTVQKNSPRVSDGISAETIKRTPDKTTSDVLKRISGASVQDNKFVIIRGLNDRYNTTYLNGAPLPSTEPDRKAFSFDIFPANMIDNLVIYKTATPDLPGEFAGGIIEINTKATPDKNFETLSIGSGYNTITTGKKQLYSRGGKTAWLGLDDGTRALPSNFPSTQEFKELQNSGNASQIASLAKSYQSDWNLYEKAFSPNTSFQYTLGRFYKLKDDKSIGLLVSVTHNKTNNYTETNRRTFDDSPGVLVTNQLDQNYSVQTLFSALGNLSYKFNSNNSLSFKNLFSINSDSRVMDRNGSLSQESDPLYISTTSRLFTNNKIYSGQIVGDHFLSESKIKINWIGSYSNVNKETPTERRNSYLYIKFDDGTASTPSAYFSTNSVGADYPGSIFSSLNKENIFSTKLDINKKIKFSDYLSTDIKVGGILQSRTRDFNARQIGYVIFNGIVEGVSYGNNTFLNSISSQPNATIFNSSNMGVLGPNSSGLTLFDGSKGNDIYTANSKLNAGYVMFDSAYKKLRMVFGARVENYSQHLDSKSDAGLPITVDDSQIDFLPSINFIYSLTKTQNVRISGSKTVNRPEFRELAPFLFYDAATKFNTSGDPALKIAEILSADFRYEIYPGKGQFFSVSAFYKDFQNPIELQAQANNSNQYKNAKTGTNLGFELEYRTLLSSVFGTENNKLFDDLTIFTNLAIIRSKVNISNLVTSATLKDIPLQGQSPYVFNGGIQYMNKEKAWSASANINRIGNRIAIHGNQTPGGATPAYWEKARTFLDFQVAKTFFSNKFEVKVNVQNALAQDLIFYQNNDLGTAPRISGFKGIVNSIFTGDSQNINGYDHKADDLVWRTKFGPTMSMSINYNF
jgi:TonB-dependent receptor